MRGHTIGYYQALRNRYLPRKLRVIFILESPPASGKYFYRESGRTTEPLFSAMMRLIRCRPLTKADGLREFKNGGYVLVDAIYRPVDKLPDAHADRLIERNYPALQKDLQRLMRQRRVPLIIVKANVWRVVRDKLKNSNFVVLNFQRHIPFPAHGWQREFHKRVVMLLDKP